MFFESPSHPSDGAPRADAGHEVCQSPACLLQNLNGRGLVMSFPVLVIGILIGHVVTLRTGCSPAVGLPQGFIVPLQRVGFDQLGPVRQNPLFAFHGRVARKHHLNPVPHRSPNHGIGDACIPT